MSWWTEDAWSINDLDLKNQKSYMAHIDPYFAKQLLKRNSDRQRSIRKNHVRELAADMSEGRWNPDVNIAMLDTEGNLIDGQHRLSAILEVGETVNMRIETGHDPMDYKVIDGGMKRSDSARTSAATDTNHNATGRMIMLLEKGIPLSFVVKGGAAAFSYYSTWAEYVDWEAGNHDMVARYTFAGRRMNGKVGSGGVRWYAIALYVTDRLYGDGEGARFEDYFCSDDPGALRLLLTLTQMYGKNKEMRPTPTMLIGTLLQAISAYNANGNLKSEKTSYNKYKEALASASERLKAM